MQAAIAGQRAPVSMGRWLRPLGSYGLTVFVLVNLNFFLPRTLPGDPIGSLAAQASPGLGGESARAALSGYYGLDRPVLAQYGHYLGGLAQGDLGRSISENRTVSSLIMERLPWTLLLVFTAVGLATFVGVIAGIHSGWRRGRGIDRGLLAVFLGLLNIPEFFLGSIVLFVFAVRLGWFPLGGARTPFLTDASPVEQILNIGHHLILPAAVLAVGLTASQYLYMRAGMVSELGAGYLLLARAKGLSERRLKYRYAARNAVLPVVTVTSLQLSLTVSGSIFVERVFAYPGMGQLANSAATGRDYPLLQGTFLVFALVVVTVNLLTDLLYGRLDPRTVA